MKARKRMKDRWINHSLCCCSCCVFRKEKKRDFSYIKEEPSPLGANYTRKASFLVLLLHSMPSIVHLFFFLLSCEWSVEKWRTSFLELEQQQQQPSFLPLLFFRFVVVGVGGSLSRSRWLMIGAAVLWGPLAPVVAHKKKEKKRSPRATLSPLLSSSSSSIRLFTRQNYYQRALS